jgi:hypothetical protein
MGIENELLKPMNADHSSICKFESINDPLYISFLNTLLELVADAERVVPERFLEPRRT